MINPFFHNKGPFKLEKVLNFIKVEIDSENLQKEIYDVKDLHTASDKDISFFHSKKYEIAASTTKAGYCLTTKQLSNILPKNCIPIEVDNVLVSTSMITEMFYPDAISDDFDSETTNIEKTSFHETVKHGKNILIGNNVKIAAKSGVISDINDNVTMGGYPSVPIKDWHRNTIFLKKSIKKNEK